MRAESSSADGTWLIGISVVSLSSNRSNCFRWVAFQNVKTQLLRACIIVNIVYISYALLALLISWWGIAAIDALDLSNYDDDQTFERLSDLTDSSAWMVVAIIQLSSGLLFASLGIIGAAKFTHCLVLACGIWYCIDLLISSLFRVWPSALMKGFFAYPHFALFMALKSGKITRENYLVERHCCCDSKSQRE